jgi:hypothetical protein
MSEIEVTVTEADREAADAFDNDLLSKGDVWLTIDERETLAGHFAAYRIAAAKAERERVIAVLKSKADYHEQEASRLLKEGGTHAAEDYHFKRMCVFDDAIEAIHDQLTKGPTR